MMQREPYESTLDLLRTTLAHFDSEADLEMVDSITSHLRDLQTTREKKILTEQTELKALAEKLAQQKQTVEEMERSKVRQDLKSRLKEAQAAEFTASKALKEMTTVKQELSATHTSLMEEFQLLDKQIQDLDFFEEAESENSLVLKLMIYRKLGVQLNLDTQSMVLYNKQKNLTDFLNYGDEKYSDYFITNYIWDRI